MNTTFRYIRLRYLLIALLLSITLILYGCLSSQPSPPLPSSSTCAELIGQALQNCYFENEQCSSMTPGNFQDSCLVQLAKKQNSTSVCQDIVSNQSKGYCLHELAILQHNNSLCSQITDTYWFDNCNYNTGIIDNKEAFCYQISPANTQQKDDCFTKVALAKLKPQTCNFLLGDKREMCVFQVAVKSADPEHCRLLQDQLNIDSCTLKIAKTTNSSELCQSIKISSIKSLCTEYFDKI